MSQADPLFTTGGRISAQGQIQLPKPHHPTPALLSASRDESRLTPARERFYKKSRVYIDQLIVGHVSLHDSRCLQTRDWREDDLISAQNKRPLSHCRCSCDDGASVIAGGFILHSWMQPSAVKHVMISSGLSSASSCSLHFWLGKKKCVLVLNATVLVININKASIRLL